MAGERTVKPAEPANHCAELTGFPRAGSRQMPFLPLEVCFGVVTRDFLVLSEEVDFFLRDRFRFCFGRHCERRSQRAKADAALICTRETAETACTSFTICSTMVTYSWASTTRLAPSSNS